MSPRIITLVTMTTAIIFYLFGFALLIAPLEVWRSLAAGEPVAVLELPVSLLGAVFLGFGAMNWVSRRSLLGGIYGRPVLLANQAHFLIGFIVLVRQGLGQPLPPAYWLFGGIYLIGTIFYSLLLFRGPAMPPE